MFLKVFGVLQVVLIQVISAQLSPRDLSSQNVLNNLANSLLVGYGRSRRQVDNAPVGSPGSEDLPVNGFANSPPIRNGLPFCNYPRASGLRSSLGFNSGLPNDLAFNNGLPNSYGRINGMALPYNSPFNSPFPNVNLAPQNRLLPNVNGININGLPFNVLNGLPSLNNVPNGLPNLNNMPNGLPNLNNMPNRLPSMNNVPNGLPHLNNIPNGLPSLNNVPNGLPNLNNMPNGLPSLNNVPNGLPNLNIVPNGLPSLNNVPNGLPNQPFLNKFLNINNVPAGNNILNFNNLPAANSLPNNNNILPILNGLPSFSNSPCGNALPLPLSSGLPLNSLPGGNLLPPVNSQLPYLNNFRITEIGIGNGVSEISRFPRNDLLDGNINLPNGNNFQSGNGLTQQIADELSKMKIYQNKNGLSGLNNPFANELSNNLQVDNRFTSINHFPMDNGASNIVNLAQNINNMQLNNELPHVSNFQSNVIPINEQKFVSNVPIYNAFSAANNYPANAAMPNANSRLVNAINNGMPLSNGGYLNDILFADNVMAVNMPETYAQNSNGNEFRSNALEFGNIQVPANNCHFDSVGTNIPGNQNVLPEGVQIFSNVPSNYQSVLMSNHLDLTQELIKNLQIEGNMPFLNGLPVAGITETVTVLNGPYSK